MALLIRKRLREKILRNELSSTVATGYSGKKLNDVTKTLHKGMCARLMIGHIYETPNVFPLAYIQPPMNMFRKSLCIFRQ